MKTILAPVDFSSASANALSFAAELAKRTAAHLLIVNISKSETEEDVEDKLTSLELHLKKTFGKDLKTESLFYSGNFITTLKKIIQAHQPELIVMGTKGATGLKKFLIGSNTVNVIAKINVPVLVVPEVARFENFLKQGKNRIVLATDLDFLNDETTVDILREIALSIDQPKVRVLNVRPENTILPDPVRAQRNFLLSIFEPEIKGEPMTVFGSSVMAGINFYLNENKDSGLIAMIANDTGKLFEKHYTREMASHTQLPLLVLHDV